MAKFADKMEKIADGVVGGYKKIENGVVGGFDKISDKFSDTFLAGEGETVEDMKARLAKEQTDRVAAAKEAAQKRNAEQNARIQASIEAKKAQTRTMIALVLGFLIGAECGFMGSAGGVRMFFP